MTVQPIAQVKKRIAISTAAQIVGQIITAAAGVVVLKLITHYLGIRQYGVYATALTFVTTFSLLTDLGLNALTAREIAKRPEQADDIIGYNMGLRLALCLTVVPVIAGLAWIVYPGQPAVLKASVMFFSVYLFFDAARAVALSYFSAKIRNDVAAAVTSGQQVLFLLLAASIAAFGGTIYGYIGAFVVSNAATAVIAVLLAKRHVSVKPRADWIIWRHTLSVSVTIGLLQVIDMIYLKADAILISVLRSPVEAGIYGVAYSLIIALMALPSYIMSALVPVIAVAHSKDLPPIIEKAYRYLAICAFLLAAGGLVVRHDIILVISSSQFTAAATPFALLAVASAFSYLGSVFGYATVALNKHQKNVYASLLVLAFNVPLNLLLVPQYGINGAAAAAIACEALSFCLIYALFRRSSGVRIPLFRHAYRPLFAAILTVAVCYKLHGLWSSSAALFNLCVSCLLVMTVYFGLLLLMRALPEEAADGVRRLRMRVGLDRRR